MTVKLFPVTVVTLCIVVSQGCGPGKDGGRDSARGGRATPIAVPNDEAFLLSCDSGAFVPATTARAVADRFGAGNVVSGRIDMGEGETQPGTILFPDDSARRVEVQWKDTLSQERPERVSVSGTRTVWKFGDGITLGTRLLDLERLNGEPVSLYGFGFDGSGVITIGSGALASLNGANCRVGLRVDPFPLSQGMQPTYDSLSGDRVFSSSNPAMRALNPRVVEMTLTYLK